MEAGLSCSDSLVARQRIQARGAGVYEAAAEAPKFARDDSRSRATLVWRHNAPTRQLLACGSATNMLQSARRGSLNDGMEY